MTGRVYNQSVFNQCAHHFAPFSVRQPFRQARILRHAFISLAADNQRILSEVQQHNHRHTMHIVILLHPCFYIRPDKKIAPIGAEQYHFAVIHSHYRGDSF